MRTPSPSPIGTGFKSLVKAIGFCNRMGTGPGRALAPSFRLNKTTVPFGIGLWLPARMHGTRKGFSGFLETAQLRDFPASFTANGARAEGVYSRSKESGGITTSHCMATTAGPGGAWKKISSVTQLFGVVVCGPTRKACPQAPGSDEASARQTVQNRSRSGSTEQTPATVYRTSDRVRAPREQRELGADASR